MEFLEACKIYIFILTSGVNIKCFYIGKSQSREENKFDEKIWLNIRDFNNIEAVINPDQVAMILKYEVGMYGEEDSNKKVYNTPERVMALPSRPVIPAQPSVCIPTNPDDVEVMRNVHGVTPQKSQAIDEFSTNFTDTGRYANMLNLHALGKKDDPDKEDRDPQK